MDLDEPLNQAHRNQRTAERAARSGNLCQAIKNYSEAAENFDRAESDFVQKRPNPVTVNADTYAIEALIAQRDFCLRQVQLLTSKLEQVRRHWAALMEKQKKQGELLSNLDYDRAISEAAILGLGSGGSQFDTNDLKARLWEKINEQDTLLEQLESDDGESSKKKPTDAVEPSKCPKSDKTVIEELRQCNEALRHFIVILLNELESKTNEIDRLKKQLGHSQSPSHRQRASTSPAKAMGKERKRATSEAANLPDLPPLELPALRPLDNRDPL